MDGQSKNELECVEAEVWMGMKKQEEVRMTRKEDKLGDA